MRVLWKYDGGDDCGDVHKREMPKPGPGTRIVHTKKTPLPSILKPQKPQKSKNK